MIFKSETPDIFLQARSETEEKIHEAVEAAFKAKPKEEEKKDNKRKSDEAGKKNFFILKKSGKIKIKNLPKMCNFRPSPQEERTMDGSRT